MYQALPGVEVVAIIGVGFQNRQVIISRVCRHIVDEDATLCDVGCQVCIAEGLVIVPQGVGVRVVVPALAVGEDKVVVEVQAVFRGILYDNGEDNKLGRA